jgi:hypothetical protein
MRVIHVAIDVGPQKHSIATDEDNGTMESQVPRIANLPDRGAN